jgi:hypothetical protein
MKGGVWGLNYWGSVMEVHGQQQVEERVHNATVKVQTGRYAKRSLSLIIKGCERLQSCLQVL